MLLAIGGKQGKQYWNNLVECLDLTYFLYPGQIKDPNAKNVPAFEMVRWEFVSPMKTARSNFASMVLDNMVYVFGGIAG